MPKEINLFIVGGVLLAVIAILIVVSVAGPAGAPTAPTTTAPTTTGQPHAHVYEQTVVEPDCTNGGHTVYTCECGESYTANETAALDHDWEDATCAAPKTCTMCGATEGEALEHSWDEGEMIQQPTLTEDGEMLYTCISCGDTRTQTVHTHNYYENAEETEPTCTDQGYTTYTCRCGESVVEDEVEPLNHDWQDATCTAPKTCSRCWVTTGSAKGHKGNAVEGYEPTCVDAGKTDGEQCTVCQAWITPQEVIPARGHVEVVVRGFAPTCTEVGLSDGKQCAVCKRWSVEQVLIPEKGHTQSVVKGTEPTYTTTGLSDGVRCADCKIWLMEQTTIPVKASTVVYDANGGSGTMQAEEYVYGTGFRFPSNTFTRSGYRFVGWSTTANGSATIFTPGQVSVTLTPDASGKIRLYAIWEKITTRSLNEDTYHYASAEWLGATEWNITKTMACDFRGKVERILVA